jgi:hypothetical protein
VPVHNEQLFDPAGPRTDDRYEDPVAKRDARFAGRWVAASAPVGKTDFVVIVQQHYRQTVRPFAMLFVPVLLSVGVGVGLVGCAGAMIVSAAMRNRGNRPQPSPLSISA